MEYETTDLMRLIEKNGNKYLNHETYVTSITILKEILKEYGVELTAKQLELLEIEHGTDHYNDNCTFYEKDNINSVFETLEKMVDYKKHKIINKKKLDYEKLLNDVNEAGDALYEAYKKI